MTFPTFHYMAWAKANAVGARWNLALSGLADPPLAVARLVETRPQGRGVLDPEAAPRAEASVAARCGVSPDRTLLTLGTSHALFLGCSAMLSRGARVLVERPTYEALVRVPAFLGAAVHRFERRPEAGWGLPEDLPRRIRDLRPTLLLITNPHNPSGTALEREALRPVLEELRRCGGILLVDEVYLEFLPDPSRRSAIHLGASTAVASSLTKAYGLGPLRFGWLLADPPVVARARQCNDLVSVNHPAPSAAIGRQALRHQDDLAAAARRVQREHLPILREWVAGREDVAGVVPRGGIIALLELRGVRDTRAFARRLRETRDTQVVPGEFFEAPGWIRVGVGAPGPELREGLRRVARLLDDWVEPAPPPA